MFRYFSKVLPDEVFLRGYLRDALTYRIDRKINQLKASWPAPLDEMEAVERVHFALKNDCAVSWRYITKAFPEFKSEDFATDSEPGFEHIK
jgi:hypothetical protein